MKEITDVEKKMIKEVYTSFVQRKADVKELNLETTEDIKALSEKLECKPKLIRSAFRFLEQIDNGEKETISEVYDIFEKARS